jgi:dTDP-4-amino-4,6-dideoxygalactose transaminase
MATRDGAKLAIDGGEPVRTRTWPEWPRADARTQRSLLDAVHSTKWTVSGASERTHSYEQAFGQAFASYVDVAYGVPCASGSAALTIALQSLDVRPGDEVIVPGLTWVACASSVCSIGAVPVLVDVDPTTLCLDPAAVTAAITSRTRAIMVVHLYSSLADLDALLDIATRHHLPVIEDGSQAHGAAWKGRRIGSFGTIGAFSLQQSKLLTSGEGGIAVTNDAGLYDRLQQLRADGRRYRRAANRQWEFRELEFAGDVFGRNLCMSELAAAVALSGLERLDEQNHLRHRNFLTLRDQIAALDGVRFIETADTADQPTFYRLCCRFDERVLTTRDAATIAEALAMELRLPVERIDVPLNDHPLYRPLLSPQVAAVPAYAARVDPTRYALPHAHSAYQTCVGLPHNALLGDDNDVADIVTALRKVLP